MVEKEDIPLELIHDGIRFVRTLSEVYGPEVGMEIWSKMGPVIGPNLHGKIFFAMLGGNNGTVVNMRAGSAVQQGNAVAVIKCIRTYTGVGLKEAKDVWDQGRDSVVGISCDSRSIGDFSRELRQLGCTIS